MGRRRAPPRGQKLTASATREAAAMDACAHRASVETAGPAYRANVCRGSSKTTAETGRTISRSEAAIVVSAPEVRSPIGPQRRIETIAKWAVENAVTGNERV